MIYYNYVITNIISIYIFHASIYLRPCKTFFWVKHDWLKESLSPAPSIHQGVQQLHQERRKVLVARRVETQLQRYTILTFSSPSSYDFVTDFFFLFLGTKYWSPIHVHARYTLDHWVTCWLLFCCLTEAYIYLRFSYLCFWVLGLLVLFCLRQDFSLELELVSNSEIHLPPPLSPQSWN